MLPCNPWAHSARPWGTEKNGYSLLRTDPIETICYFTSCSEQLQKMGAGPSQEARGRGGWGQLWTLLLVPEL